jgi:soluble lytic murein transglycosylase-like protein
MGNHGQRKSSRKLAGIAPHKLRMGRGHMRYLGLAMLALALAQPARAEDKPRSPYDALIASHAEANGIPASLVHRVILSESRYNPRAVGSGGAMGLMQIKHATARALGYRGDAAGLLDPETNLTYAVRYLAGAFRAAGGNVERAIAYFRSGYYKSPRKPLDLAAVAAGKPASKHAVATAPPKPAKEAEATASPAGGE